MSIKTKKYKDMDMILEKDPPKIPVPDSLFPLPMLGEFVACRGSGKTVAMTTLGKRYVQHDLCHRVFVICPTFASNGHLYEGLPVDENDVFVSGDIADLKAIDAAVSQEGKEWYEFQARESVRRKVDRMDPNRMSEQDFEIVAHAEEINAFDPEQYRFKHLKHPPCLFLIVDDCMGTPIFTCKTRDISLRTMCMQHRHLGSRVSQGARIGLSIMIAVQAFKSATGNLSKDVRQNLTLQCFWGMRNEQLIKDISEECNREIDPETLKKMYDYATSGSKHDFFTICFDNRTFRKNFSELLEHDRPASPSESGAQTTP